MTLEQAQTMKAGDIISCAHNSKRVLTNAWVVGDHLYWHQEGMGTVEHSWKFEDIEIIHKSEPVVINNYQIF